MDNKKGERQRVVCVTGAGGFAASWLVKLLISSDYTVHATIRHPSDPKNEHLKKLDKASEKLTLFKADLLDYDSIAAAINGCVGVFHVASPVPSTRVPDPQVHLMEPAVKGTLNVLKACFQAKVKRLVFVSSIAAVFMNPNWPAAQPKDENCWSNLEYCKTTNNWYFASKTEAEIEAFKYARNSGLDVVSVCPTLILGPMMQPTVNTSSLVLMKILKGGYNTRDNKVFNHIVDVRDLVVALLMLLEKPDAEGRYICSSHNIKARESVGKLQNLYLSYSYPINSIEIADEKVTSQKLQKLGWTYRPLEETLVDSVESYRKFGLLD